MRLSVASKAALLGVALLATSAFAANKGSLNLSAPTSIGGQQVDAGEYRVQWEGNGPSVQVNVMKGKKVVATAPARVVDVNQPTRSDSTVVKSNGNGSRALQQIRFAGKKFVLELGEQSASAASPSSGNTTN
jgi:uncharacterized protein YfaP (DUF2135 family)